MAFRLRYWRFSTIWYQWFKWSREAGGLDHPTKPGWANPIPIPHPTNLALSLFGHKITLYRFNRGLIILQGVSDDQIWTGGWAPSLTTVWYFVSHQSAAVCRQFRRSMHNRGEIFSSIKHQKTSGGRAPSGWASALPRPQPRKREKTEGEGREGERGNRERTG